MQYRLVLIQITHIFDDAAFVAIGSADWFIAALITQIQANVAIEESQLADPRVQRLKVIFGRFSKDQRISFEAHGRAMLFAGSDCLQRRRSMPAMLKTDIVFFAILIYGHFQPFR